MKFKRVSGTWFIWCDLCDGNGAHWEKIGDEYVADLIKDELCFM